MTSCLLLMTEAPRALRRGKAEEPRLELTRLLRNAERLLRTMVLRPLDPLVLREAAALPEPHLGSLDAIHVATAVQLRPLIKAFVTYDKQQGAVAREVGLSVVMPGA
jgi:predicted nucleic acid-binding protein